MSQIHDIRSLLRHCSETTCQLPDGRWVPARPIGGFVTEHIKAAWLVLTGKADAVVWPGQ